MKSQIEQQPAAEKPAKKKAEAKAKPAAAVPTVVTATKSTIVIPDVYAAISDVARELAGVGIGKTRENEKQKYKFRGIEEVMNALAGPLCKRGLLALPFYTSFASTEKVTASGTPMNYVIVTGEFHFISCRDASKHIVRTFGEAADSGDKATNKAMSAAFKYALFQSFCIPTEGIAPDADMETYELKSVAAKVHTDTEHIEEETPSADVIIVQMREAIAQCPTKEQARARLKDYKKYVDALPDAERDLVRVAANECLDKFGAAAA